MPLVKRYCRTLRQIDLFALHRCLRRCNDSGETLCTEQDISPVPAPEVLQHRQLREFHRWSAEFCEYVAI